MRYHFEHGRRDRRETVSEIYFFTSSFFWIFQESMLQKSANLKRQKLSFLEFALKYLKTE